MDDVPVEELMGLVEEPPRAKHKTPYRSAIIIRKQVGRRAVKIGTKRDRKPTPW